MYQIEKVKVPIPASSHRGMYPLKDMQVGDSFVVPVGDQQAASSIQGRLMMAAKKFKDLGRDFTTRTFTDSSGRKCVRCWRIK